ncbi:glycosyltransferase [candidate division KSB3 bacterium]|uniref:Glycosyltransferase n=1 Tax=candidate division KSB3 bacterium TaxID=2044937 RepID=A0A9D5K0L0_9BACT|nr:glycosyltransferase [candidate division KSB3 bacterium]MBD3327440.1 glycosyltransferase [candidate division KSB3 bacterium]
MGREGRVSMRIAIDVQPLQTGTRFNEHGYYLRNVLQHLSRLDGDNEYTFLLNNAAYLADVTPPAFSWKKHYVTRKHLLGRWWWRWDTVYLPTVFLRKNIDLYHYNSLAEWERMIPPIPFGKHRVVATIYDMLPLKFPEDRSASGPSSRWAGEYATKLHRLAYADVILTLSECSKQDILSLLPLPESRIVVTSCGLADHFTHPPASGQAERVRATYHLPEAFILYPGGYVSRRKNIERLLEAYDLLRQALPAPLPALVLAGLSQPADQEQVASLLHKRNLALHVMTLPYIPEEDRPYLYRAATLLVYPSLYEGFARPVAEALACGAVVAASNTSSFPEIAGDAAFYFDPYDSANMAEVMAEGLSNIPRRQDFQHRGPDQAARFSWETTARKILAVYNQV